MTQIKINQLHKCYPRQTMPAVNQITLNIPSGTLLALLGPSGSGKSTILKLIAGIDQPDAGSIHFDGQDMADVAANRRGAVLMFQKAYLFPFLSVADNIAFGLKIKRMPRTHMMDAVRQMLDLVELPGIEGKRPAQLSGGEQQRVALARALVTRPHVLLLDEPFSSLDPAVRQTLQEAVQRIQRELGITMLLVTHDRSEAMSMADQVALLDQGRLLACNTPRQLFQRPPTRRAARLMGVSTFLDGTLDGNRLHTRLGALTVDAIPNGCQRTIVAIRPEHLRLLPTPGPNALPAHVAERTFRGEHVEYRLCVGEETIRVRTSEGDNGDLSGSVFVQFPVEHLFVVEDDESEQQA